MNTRALSLALHLLCTSAAAAAGLTLSGCGCGPGYDPWGDTQALELETDIDLHAVVRAPANDYGYEALAVGAGGSLLAWGFDYENYDPETYEPGVFVDHIQVGEHDLRDVWADESGWWIVGDAGSVFVSVDYGLTWATVDIGTTADLRRITNVGSRMLIVGDDIVLLQGGDGLWTVILPPQGSWGELRAVHYDGSRVYVVGRAGKAWSAADPSGEWVAEAVETSVDLFDVGSFQWAYDEPLQPVIVGADGTMLLRGDSGWKKVDTRTKSDLIAYEDGGVLAADGKLYEVGKHRRLQFVDTLANASAMTFRDGSGAIAVGPDGVAYDKGFYYCPGGRPFVVEGESIVAELRGSTRPTDEVAAEHARRWVRDGLVEHASVASFARFALELLALGAPPSLLREVQVAIADELRHARLCFGLAERFGTKAQPEALAMPSTVLARSGAPVEIALALFEEGCINESLAACEAADAAESCEDTEVRAVLETIAADERRHATLAWRALRWLIDTHGDRVRVPLRARLARLETRRPAGEVHRRVVAELISPLGRALLWPAREAA